MCFKWPSTYRLFPTIRILFWNEESRCSHLSTGIPQPTGGVPTPLWMFHLFLSHSSPIIPITPSYLSSARNAISKIPSLLIFQFFFFFLILYSESDLRPLHFCLVIDKDFLFFFIEFFIEFLLFICDLNVHTVKGSWWHSIRLWP